MKLSCQITTLAVVLCCAGLVSCTERPEEHEVRIMGIKVDPLQLKLVQYSRSNLTDLHGLVETLPDDIRIPDGMHVATRTHFEVIDGHMVFYDERLGFASSINLARVNKAMLHNNGRVLLLTGPK